MAAYIRQKCAHAFTYSHNCQTRKRSARESVPRETRHYASHPQGRQAPRSADIIIGNDRQLYKMFRNNITDVVIASLKWRRFVTLCHTMDSIMSCWVAVNARLDGVQMISSIRDEQFHIISKIISLEVTIYHLQFQIMLTHIIMNIDILPSTNI